MVGYLAMHSQPCRAIIRVSYISTVKFVIQVYVGEEIKDNYILPGFRRSGLCEGR